MKYRFKVDKDTFVHVNFDLEKPTDMVGQKLSSRQIIDLYIPRRVY